MAESKGEKEKERDRRITQLLNDANRLLHEDIEKEAAAVEGHPFGSAVNTGKYERAKKLFEVILMIDPENEGAQEGLDACNEMLTPYYPVQYMMPIDGDITEVPPVKGGRSPLKVENKTPWEIIRERRARDAAGMKYTEDEFSKARAVAYDKVENMVESAVRTGLERNLDPKKIFDLVIKEMVGYQEELNRSWKGHGPKILEAAKYKLRQALHLSGV
ncbi:MAG: hypothetical protein ACTSUE_26040 [Promethearchaeota archaeon]